MADAGGSLPTWLILLSLKQAPSRTQRDLAHAVGIKSPTMTRHLDNLVEAGLLARSRDPDDRRIMRVELTDAGEEAFHRLRKAASAFDEQLRSGFADHEVAQLRALLERLRSRIDR